MSGIVFIVNSRSKASQQTQFTRALLTHVADQPHEVHLTQYEGHAVVLAKEAVAKQAKAIVAVGGDGTVNEILQGIGLSGIPLGIIPMGSGNGLARHVGIPLHPMDAMAALVNSEIQAIDLGQVNELYFISNCGVGYDAHIAERIKTRNRRGLLMYIQETMFGFLGHKPETYTITLDNNLQITQQAFMLNVANGREFGYGFTIAPQAALQDGMLDVLLLKPFPWYSAGQLVWDAWRGNWHKNKYCEHHRAQKIHLKHPVDLPLQTDGDARSWNKEYTIFVHPGMLRLIVPRGTRNL
jgi:YegS/Rv2252/BmrU family lipid kinase